MPEGQPESRNFQEDFIARDAKIKAFRGLLKRISELGENEKIPVGELREEGLYDLWQEATRLTMEEIPDEPNQNKNVVRMMRQITRLQKFQELGEKNL